MATDSLHHLICRELNLPATSSTAEIAEALRGLTRQNKRLSRIDTALRTNLAGDLGLQPEASWVDIRRAAARYEYLANSFTSSRENLTALRDLLTDLLEDTP